MGEKKSLTGLCSPVPLLWPRECFATPGHPLAPPTIVVSLNEHFTSQTSTKTEQELYHRVVMCNRTEIKHQYCQLNSGSLSTE